MINDDWFFRAMDQLDAMLIKILRFSLDATLFPLPLASERASNLAVSAHPSSISRLYEAGPAGVKKKNQLAGKSQGSEVFSIHGRGCLKSFFSPLPV